MSLGQIKNLTVLDERRREVLLQLPPKGSVEQISSILKEKLKKEIDAVESSQQAAVKASLDTLAENFSDARGRIQKSIAEVATSAKTGRDQIQKEPG
jgi:gas vesicle protein